MRTIRRAPWQTPKPRLTLRGSLIDPELRGLVFTRAGGRCECCAERLNPADWECHHRKLRSRGGQDSACNLLALCPTCHRRIHGHPAWATDHGFMCPTSEDPALFAVAVHQTSWRLLTCDGAYRNAETGGDAS